MKISYGIIVKDEIDYIPNLIKTLFIYLNRDDEIVVLQDIDLNNPSEKQLEVRRYLINCLTNKIIKKYSTTKFYNDFSKIKNELNLLCENEYIFNIDADEIPTKKLLKILKPLLKNNPNTDLFFVPRINIVEGITDTHFIKWKWNFIEHEQYGKIINFPDLQGRIYKNIPDKIKWKNKVHEYIIGYETYSIIPYQTFDYCLIHKKDIIRQEKQNELYEKI